MSHAIYQTPAIILKTKNMRESNKLVLIYTQRFGLIYASTQSIRNLQSKMRFHMQIYSLVYVDVVRGRDIWRITGIHESIPSLSFLETPFYSFVDRVGTLLLRLSQGEEAHDGIWHDLNNLYQKRNFIAIDTIEVIEIITLVRLLYFLGYWDGYQNSIDTDDIFDPDLFEHVSMYKSEYVRLINQGIRDSQL